MQNDERRIDTGLECGQDLTTTGDVESDSLLHHDPLDALGILVSIATDIPLAPEAGLVIGALMGAAFFAFAFAIWGEADVAVAVSLAISCSIASVVAMALPYALAGLGRNPAFGSGPLATVTQDQLSIVTYFAVAILLVF